MKCVKEQRNSNFELMRIVSMLFIILWHIIRHGNMISNCDSELIRVILYLVEYIIIVHVNSFVVLSGYFQSKSKFKLSKLVSLFLQVVFYGSIIYLIAIKLGFISTYNGVDFLNKFTFSSLGEYWFIKTYVVVYIFSDYINIFIDRLSKREYKGLLLLLFLMFSIVPMITGGNVMRNDGYNFYNFIFLYMIGGYLRKYPLKISNYFNELSSKRYIILMIFIFFVMALFNFSLYCFVDAIKNIDNSYVRDIAIKLSYSRFNYSNFLVIIQTICYFEVFKMISFKSRVINFISSCTFGIYLFHDNEIVRKNIYKLLRIDNGFALGINMFINTFFVLIFLFFLGVVIEVIRKLIFSLIVKLISLMKLKDGFKKVRKLFNTFVLRCNYIEK